jgi:cell division protein FtsQ
MRRVKPAKSLQGARLLLLRRRVQRYLPRRPGRFFGVSALVVLASLGGIAAIDQLDRGSRLQSVLLRTTAALGFAVADVEVEGRKTTPAEDVLKAIDVGRGMPIFAVSPERARERLESLPWVRSATVERRLPDTILVTLVERQPLALWQHGGKMALVDTEGVVVTTEHLDRYADLLLVVGENAPKHAADLLNVIQSPAPLRARVQSAVWVGDRRWNLIFDGGITIEMPETGLADAWARLVEIEEAHGLLARDIAKADLRLPDRVTVTPAQAAKPAQSAANPSGAKPAAAKPAAGAKPGTKPT